MEPLRDDLVSEGITFPVSEKIGNDTRSAAPASRLTVLFPLAKPFDLALRALLDAEVLDHVLHVTNLDLWVVALAMWPNRQTGIASAPEDHQPVVRALLSCVAGRTVIEHGPDILERDRPERGHEGLRRLCDRVKRVDSRGRVVADILDIDLGHPAFGLGGTEFGEG